VFGISPAQFQRRLVPMERSKRQYRSS
jgi:hypothetical protein